MTKTQYIILGIIVAVVILAVFGIFNIFGASPSPGPSQNPDGQNTFPDTRPAVTPGSQQTSTTTTQKDILKDPQTKEDANNKGHYFVGNSIDASSTAPPNVPYVIEYIASTRFYSIALFQEPLSDSRAAAEQFLMSRLEIPQSGMCHLKYMVSVPGWVNQMYAGTSLGFSFCPGATLLP